MKLPIYFSLLLIMMTLPSLCHGDSSGGIVNKSAPTFRLPDQNSSKSLPFVMADHFAPDSQHVVIVTFFATWCVPCRKELPFLQHVVDSLYSKGLRMVAVCVDSAYGTKQKKMVSELHLTCPVVHDKYGILVRRYECGKELPYTVFVNKNGIVSNKSVGYSADKQSILKIETDKLLKGN